MAGCGGDHAAFAECRSRLPPRRQEAPSPSKSLLAAAGRTSARPPPARVSPPVSHAPRTAPRGSGTGPRDHRFELPPPRPGPRRLTVDAEAEEAPMSCGTCGSLHSGVPVRAEGAGALLDHVAGVGGGAGNPGLHAAAPAGTPPIPGDHQVGRRSAGCPPARRRRWWSRSVSSCPKPSQSSKIRTPDARSADGGVPGRPHLAVPRHRRPVRENRPRAVVSSPETSQPPSCSRSTVFAGPRVAPRSV